MSSNIVKQSGARRSTGDHELLLPSSAELYLLRKFYSSSLSDHAPNLLKSMEFVSFQNHAWNHPRSICRGWVEVYTCLPLCNELAFCNIFFRTTDPTSERNERFCLFLGLCKENICLCSKFHLEKE